jgi:Protein of unknown function (DUF4244)
MLRRMRTLRRFAGPPVAGLLSIVVMLVVGRQPARRDDAGMSTAEYAVGTVAAVAFAVVLYKIVRSPAVSAALSAIVQHALHAI